MGETGRTFRERVVCGQRGAVHVAGVSRRPKRRRGQRVMDRLAGAEEREIEILFGSPTLRGILRVPQGAIGIRR